MTDETTAAPAAVQTEQVNEVDVETAETTAAEPQETESGEQETQETTKKVPWFQKRINEVTREKYELQREAQALREHVARVQQGEQPNQGNDIQQLVTREAQRLMQERSFNDTCNKVYDAGNAEFKDFDSTVGNLQMVGVGRDFLELATMSDAGAKMLHYLGKNLEEAQRIANLPPVHMAREMTKLEFKLSQKQTKPVSNAPQPISPISGATGGTKDPSTMTDAEYAKWSNSLRKR